MFTVFSETRTEKFTATIMAGRLQELLLRHIPSVVGHEVRWSCFSWASVPPEVDTWDNFCGYMKEQEKGLLGMQSFLNGGGGKMGVVGER